MVTWDHLPRRSALYFAVKDRATGLTAEPVCSLTQLIRSIPRALTRVRVERSKWGLTLPATARTRQAFRAYSRTAAEPPELHVGRPNLSLDDLLRFVIAPLHVTLGSLIGCLRRF